MNGSTVVSICQFFCVRERLGQERGTEAEIQIYSALGRSYRRLSESSGVGFLKQCVADFLRRERLFFPTSVSQLPYATDAIRL